MKSTLYESGRADLRRVLAQMEAAAPLAPDLETPTEVRPELARRGGVTGLIGVAVVTALILPAALLWGPPAEEPDRVPVGAEPPVQPNTTPTTAVPAVEWTSTELSNFVDAVTVHEGRFYTTSAQQVLVSDDGVEWTTAGSLPAGSHIGELVSHGGNLVGRGSETTEDTDGGKLSTPMVLTSTDDGKTWFVSMVGAPLGGVTSTPAGLVAPGFIELEPVGDQLPREAAVWTSDNGIDWTLAWQDEGDVARSSRAVDAIWDDGLVVIGWQGPANFSEGSGKDGPEWDKVAWTAPTASALSASAPTNILGHIADHTQSSSGHFALTYSVDPSVKDSSAVWRSDDGIEWTQVDVGAGWYHTAIATEGSMIVIGGDTLGFAPEPETRIWVSTDGANWHDFDTSALPEGLRVRSVALHDGVLVVALYSNDKIGGYLMSTRINP